MQINNIQQNNVYKKPSFGAKPIDSVNLMRRTVSGTYRPVKAVISELDFDDAADKKLVKHLEALWYDGAKYISDIADSFREKTMDTKFYICEIMDKGKKYVTNIMQTNDPKCTKHLEIDYLQSAPFIVNQKGCSQIKGSGETAIYEAVKIAKEHNCKDVSWLSTNNSFYEHLGLKPVSEAENCKIFEIANENYSSFLQKITKKYGM